MIRRCRIAAALLLGLTLTPVSVFAQAANTPVMPPVGDVSLIAPALRATDLDRSIRFYATALGLVVATTLHHGPLTEVILCFDTPKRVPAIMLVRDETPGKSPPVDMGNGFSRLVMHVSDVAAIAARLKAKGYPVGQVQSGKGPAVLQIKDPDGYAYELVQNGPVHG